MNSTIRILLALAMGFVIGFVMPLANGLGPLEALQAGLGFAFLVGVIVAILSWGMDIAIEKGYPGWLGFLLALVFNILGLVILLLLPRRTAITKKPASR
jgi:hypothetical protein